MSESTAMKASELTAENRGQKFALFAIIGFLLFIAIMFAFHFIQPELNPLTRFGSEYAVGRMGWLMNIAFYCFAIGLASLTNAFNRCLKPPTKSRAGEILLCLSTLGVVGSGIFNADLQTAESTATGALHDLSGFLLFLTIIPAIIVFSRRFRMSNLLRNEYRALWLLSWLVLFLFLSMIFAFDPFQLIGLGQRIFLAVMFSWLILAARGVQTGAFLSVNTENAQSSAETMG